MIDTARYAERMLRERSNLSPEERADLEAIVQKSASHDVFGDVSLVDASAEYREVRDVLSRKEFGAYTTSIPLRALSLDQLVDDPQTKEYLGFVNPSRLLREVVSPAIEVVVNAATIAPKETAGLSFKDLEEWLAIEEDRLQRQTGLGNRIGLPMHHAPSLVQFDTHYQRANSGRKLFPDYWVRSIDPPGDRFVAIVGRRRPGYPLFVHDWRRFGYPLVRGARAVVLPPRK